ncbi:DUF2934 domain-containing protein [Paludibaculum fermentans]|uniref:DUF2934 domain-containing protein n=1 Tax=Paludibaculum fermentans TaxID=1473598 RepID=UPI003EBB2CB7
MALVSNAVREPVPPARREGPTESEIAALAYQLWVAKGCPLGTNREDWLQAEALLNAVFAAISQDSPNDPMTVQFDSRGEAEILAELLLDGHWEVWEREWGGARWIPDSRHFAG